MLKKTLFKNFLCSVNRELDLNLAFYFYSEIIHVEYNNVKILIKKFDKEDLEKDCLFEEKDILDAISRFRELICEIKNRKLPNDERDPYYQDIDVILKQKQPVFFKTDCFSEITITYLN